MPLYLGVEADCATPMDRPAARRERALKSAGPLKALILSSRCGNRAFLVH
jgi:hypothetical protein